CSYFLCFVSHSSDATYTLNQGAMLNFSNRLVSGNGLFALGFAGQYLVINYTNGDDLSGHPVWSANGDKTIRENAGVLTIVESGKLKIIHGDGQIELYQVSPRIELYQGQSASTSKLTAVLQDDGNFVLKHETANSSEDLWESFDYPTDTLLPKMKLGINKKTGKTWKLTSWFGEDIPRPAAFTMEWDPSERQVIVKRRGIKFWTSGMLTHDNKLENFRQDESNSTITSLGFQPKKRITLCTQFSLTSTSTREIKKGIMFPGGSRLSGKNDDSFALRSGYFESDMTRYEDNNNLSFLDCKDLCWEDCSCTGFQQAVGRSGCVFARGHFYRRNLKGCEENYYIIIEGPPLTWDERSLIYEYMSNKSLDSFIFDQSKRVLLDWRKRFSVIEGIAQGLLYLHKYSRLRVIHRDLKTSNILLGKDMNPKISDFGMVRIFKVNESEANTNRIIGNYGYMFPEYAMEDIFSVKSDVYSFGVLMLEIISSKRNHSTYHYDRPLNLVGYALELWKEDVFEMLDPTSRDSAPREQVLRCINVALLWVEHSPFDMPNMAEVLSMLANEIQQLPMPKQPAFYVGTATSTESTSGDKGRETYSASGLSLTDMAGR
ncbi:G-type lectin S-receptor-like serine/threonine-protein kinase CES101, partial [Hevea brasiliensis]|uniref:G-type lectin S-receptor-like serine/threonine-protein kinase CES101 n=1 Tax=Hevea brasiliensis TaxID=3981 RepID=UPI0025D142C9